ncbi:unnamed protein product [Merluccius merluccius]
MLTVSRSDIDFSGLRGIWDGPSQWKRVVRPKPKSLKEEQEEQRSRRRSPAERESPDLQDGGHRSTAGSSRGNRDGLHGDQEVHVRAANRVELQVQTVCQTFRDASCSQRGKEGPQCSTGSEEVSPGEGWTVGPIGTGGDRAAALWGHGPTH